MSLATWQVLSGRLSTLGASTLELAAIQASYFAMTPPVQGALDTLTGSLANADLLVMLNTWRTSGSPFHAGLPGGGLPFGTGVAVLTGQVADDASVIGAGTGRKLSAMIGDPVGRAAEAARLSTVATKLAKIVAQPLPSVGSSITVATLTGAGIITNVWFALGAIGYAKNGRVQVYLDGESVPSIDVDLGTLFCCLENAAAATGNYYTRHTHVGINSGGETTMALRFPIPYSNGAVVKLFNPKETVTTPFNDIFGQVMYQPGAVAGVTDRWRLRSASLPYVRAMALQKTQVGTLFDITNAAGRLVYFAAAMKGSSGYSYLERPYDVYVDGEGSPSYQSSGSEDFFNTGWFFNFSLFSNPFSMVTANNNAPGSYNVPTTYAAVDLYELLGGIRFNTELKLAHGSADEIKSPGATTSEHVEAFAALWYCDISTPAVPGAPQGVLAQPTSGGCTVSWTQLSQGSSPVTLFTVVATATGHTTVTQTSTGQSATLTGLTNGVAYNLSVTATNSVGSSPAATTTVTPGTGAYDTAVAADSPVAYWKLAEAPGAASAADSAGANTGTYNGAPYLGLPGATGDNLTALWLNDGSSQNISVPSAAAIQLVQPFTFETWMMLINYPSSFPVILGKSSDGSFSGSDYGWQFSAATGKQQLVTASNAAASAATTAMPFAVWTHLALTYDGANVRYYFNGQPDGVVAFATNSKTSTGALTIGTWASFSAPLFARIQRLALYSTALSAARILAHYNAR